MFRYSARTQSLLGVHFCAFPRSEQLRRPGVWQVDCPRWAVHLNHLPSPSQFPGCAVCLLWGADLRLQPSWQMSTIQDPRETWLATGSLLTVWWRMAISGAKIGAAPCHLALAVHACFSDSTGGEGPVCSRLALLWYSLNPLFCEQARLRVR